MHRTLRLLSVLLAAVMQQAADNGLISTTRSTVDLLKKHGFAPVFNERLAVTPGSTGAII